MNLEPASLGDVLASVGMVAAATGVADRATAVVADLQRRIDTVVARVADVEHRPRTILLEWIDPLFTCGHWSPELVRLAGGIEGLGREGEPSRRARWDEIFAWQPEVLVVACCGFDVERTLRDLPTLAARRHSSSLREGT